MTPRRSLVFVLFGIALVASACGRYGTEYAAVVDGHPITFDALTRAVRAAGPGTTAVATQRQVLLQLMARELIDDQLANDGVVITRAQVQSQLAQIKAGYPNEQAYEQALQQAGLDDVTVLQQIHDQLAASALQLKAGAAPVTEADLAAAYRADIATYTQVHARHILFSTQSRSDAAALALANATLAELRAGADFVATAKRVSDDTGSKTAGGDLGTTPASTFIPEFAKVVATAPIGVVTGPVKTQFGYHLVLVVSRTFTPLSAVKDQIRAQLEQQRGQAALQSYFAKLVRSADIEVNPRIGDLDLSTLSIVNHQFFIPSSPTATPIASLPPVG